MVTRRQKGEKVKEEEEREKKREGEGGEMSERNLALSVISALQLI